MAFRARFRLGISSVSGSDSANENNHQKDKDQHFSSLGCAPSILMRGSLVRPVQEMIRKRMACDEISFNASRLQLLGRCMYARKP